MKLIHFFPTRFVAAAALLGALALPVPTVLAQSYEDGALVHVDATRLEPLEQKVPVIGRIVARQAGVVAAQVDGPVALYLVDVGDRVDKDDIMVLLDKKTIQARRDFEAADIVRSEAELRTARAELQLAMQELGRIEKLKSSAAFSQARYDDARQRVVISEGQVGEAEAAILSASADLEIMEIALSNTEIRAPYAGVVSRKLSEAGAYVRSGDAVLRLVGDEALEIEADVPFDRIGGLDIGSEVDLSLDDGTLHSAKVRAILPEENPLTRTRTVRFVPSFGETGRPLAVEQSATVHVPVGGARDIVTVHKDAVIQRGSNSLVFVVKDGQAEMRPIVLGEPAGSRYEVLHGLAEGEDVVVRGNERLRPGDKVRVNGAS